LKVSIRDLKSQSSIADSRTWIVCRDLHKSGRRLDLPGTGTAVGTLPVPSREAEQYED
jgi:hypothetical protein